MKQNVKITVFEDNCNYDIPETPKEFMQFWKDKLSLIPDEFMDTAKIKVEAEPYYESASLDVTVSYTRPETDEEETERLKKEKARREYAEQQELCTLERLKNKYKC